MAKKTRTPEEIALAERLKGWLVYYRDIYRHQCPNDKDFAALIGIPATHVSQVISKPERGIGLMTLVKMHRNLRVSLDQMVDTDAPRQGGATAVAKKSAST